MASPTRGNDRPWATRTQTAALPGDYIAAAPHLRLRRTGNLAEINGAWRHAACTRSRLYRASSLPLGSSETTVGSHRTRRASCSPRCARQSGPWLRWCPSPRHLNCAALSRFTAPGHAAAPDTSRRYFPLRAAAAVRLIVSRIMPASRQPCAGSTLR